MKTRIGMTPEEARTFSTYSAQNAATVEATLACGCKAYEDIFTYRRWQALGFQVQKGERAVKIPVVKTVARDDEHGTTQTRRFLGSGAVFCRHQVQPVAEAGR